MSTTAFPVNPTLTAIAIAYKNPEGALIADQVLPRVPVGKKFKYTKYSAEQAYTVPRTRVGRKSEPTLVDFGGTEITDECVDFGLDDIVPNDEQAAWEAMPKAAGTPSPVEISTMMLTHLVELDREIRVATLIFADGTYPAANRDALSGTDQFSDVANSDPIGVISEKLDIPLIRPNVMVIGRAAFTKLASHPDIVQAAKGTAQTAGRATRQQIAELFELRDVLVGEAFYNTARKGQAPVNARAWGKHLALLHISTLAAQMGQPTFGFTGQFGTRVAGDIPEPRVGLRGGNRVRSGESVKEVISASDLGFFLKDVIA